MVNNALKMAWKGGLTVRRKGEEGEEGGGSSRDGPLVGERGVGVE